MLIAGEQVGVTVRLIGGSDLFSAEAAEITIFADTVGQTQRFVPEKGRELGMVTITQERLDELMSYEAEALARKNRPVTITIPDSFGDGLRRAKNSSYDRPCGNPACKRMIHKHNRAGICTDCFMAGYPAPNTPEVPAQA